MLLKGGPVAIGLNFALQDSDSLARAGYTGDVFEQADKLFDAIIAEHSGVIFSKDNMETVWGRLGHEGRIRLMGPTLLDELKVLEAGPANRANGEFPFALVQESAGTTRQIRLSRFWLAPERSADHTQAQRCGNARHLNGRSGTHHHCHRLSTGAS